MIDIIDFVLPGILLLTHSGTNVIKFHFTFIHDQYDKFLNALCRGIGFTCLSQNKIHKLHHKWNVSLLHIIE